MKAVISVFFTIIISLNVYCNTLNDIIDKTIRFDNWNDAKILLQEYISANSTDTYAYFLLAETYNNLKDYDQAINSIKTAVGYETSNEKKGELYYNLGIYYFNKNTADIALEMFEKSISLNQFLAQPHYMSGLIYYNKKNIDQCILHWEKYVSLTDNLEKKQRVETILGLLKKEIADEKQRVINEQKRKEEEARRQEEEKRKRQQALDDLKKELEKDNKDTQSLETYRIKDKVSDDELDGVQ